VETIPKKQPAIRRFAAVVLIIGNKRYVLPMDILLDAIIAG
jgi:hypothetical protein